MRTTTVIPCKRPRVTYDGDTHHCQVPGCGWTFRSVKSADEVRWHKAAHRNAVPSTDIHPTDDGRHLAFCACRAEWKAPTKAHARTWLRHHLELDHGLVECP